MNFWRHLRRVGSMVFIVVSVCVLLWAALRHTDGAQPAGPSETPAPQLRPGTTGPSGL
jgi:hypothetical protein